MTTPAPAVVPGELTGQTGIDCFHCGQPVPANTDYSITFDGALHSLCCPGCEAVAKTIIAAGLDDFYRHRTQNSPRAEGIIPEQLRILEIFDQPETQKSFVRDAGEHLREASLILEGIVCAACVWLNERHVCALPGVIEFRVNYATHRALLRWDERQIKLSEILAAIGDIGYKAHPFDPERQETLQKKERAAALRRLAVAALGAMQVMMLAVAMYAGDYYGMDESMRQFLRWISLLITLPVIGYAARPFFSAAWRDLRHRQLGMDVPVALALTGAFSASLWVTWQGGGEVYYDSVTMFTFFLLGGRFLEMSARHNAGRVSEELGRILPATVTRLDNDGAEHSIALAQLAVGDQVLVRPGDTIPADGRVIEGTSSVDEALLTGESLPLGKTLDDALVGGSLNVESPLIMRVEKLGPDTTLSAIVRLLERAQSEKPRLALLANRIAAWFVGAILLIAAAVAWWWWRHDPDSAFRVTLSVLVVTCPCALSLATPTALTAATTLLNRYGLLITRSHALETLARASHIVFDKTGTLTVGRLELESVTPLHGDAEHCLALAAALERGSEHPIARALTQADHTKLRAEDLKNTPGRGVEGVINGECYRLGKADFVAQGGDTDPRDPSATRVALGDSRRLLAWFRLSDRLRPDAAATLAALRALGLKTLLLSGDRPETVADVAAPLRFAEAHGDLLPADKLTRIKALQDHGAVVAMVGDGLNDAPVLAGAQVSIAMGGGTQLAHSAADMILLSEQLTTLVQGIRIARRTLTIIRQNFAWAIAYNIVALPLAAAGWIAPWMAALGMSLSSLLVVANASRIKLVSPQQHQSQ